MAQVFIVTSGDYSDYRINKAFSTRELADDWIREAPSGHYMIEPHELDGVEDRPFCISNVELDHLTGDAIGSIWTINCEKLDDFDTSIWIDKRNDGSGDRRVTFRLEVRTADEEEALKVAAELWTKARSIELPEGRYTRELAPFTS